VIAKEIGLTTTPPLWAGYYYARCGVREFLADDHAKMVAERILIGKAESFDDLMKKSADLQKRANQV
jgi:hypothetical protein